MPIQGLFLFLSHEPWSLLGHIFVDAGISPLEVPARPAHLKCVDLSLAHTEPGVAGRGHGAASSPVSGSCAPGSPGPGQLRCAEPRGEQAHRSLQ